MDVKKIDVERFVQEIRECAEGATRQIQGNVERALQALTEADQALRAEGGKSFSDLVQQADAVLVTEFVTGDSAPAAHDMHRRINQATIRLGYDEHRFYDRDQQERGVLLKDGKRYRALLFVLPIGDGE